MAFAWATFDAEGAGPAGGGVSLCQGGDEHVHRYMAAMDVRFSNTWKVLSGDHPSYDPVMVPSLCLSTARTSGTAGGLDYSLVFDLY